MPIRHRRRIILALLLACTLPASIGIGHVLAGPATPRLYVTPALIAPAAKARATVHLRGLVPGSPVEVQVNPPAPAMATLADFHTKASRRGTLDLNLSFPAAQRGPYMLFVNLGSYADAKSPVKGSSLQGIIPVDTPGPHLALPCGAPLRAIVACSPIGYGFKANESVALTYRIQIGMPNGGHKLSVVRRTTHTDSGGIFQRPDLSFNVNERVLSYRVTFVAQGASGDHAETGAAGTP